MMLIKRVIPLLAIVLTLAGCFRQADEPFDTVNSQNVPQSIPATDDTQAVQIIDPNATESLPPTADSQQVEPEPTATVIIINPTVAQVEPSATVETIIIEPATSEPLTIPTATESGFITPEFGGEVDVPTATATQIVEQATLEPTPTVFEEDIVVSECQYVVQSGDNLFRIALNNDIPLNTLLSENGLSEASIIQPGQTLILPGCTDEETTTTTDDEIVIPSPVPLTECQYVIQAGETLFGIAIRNNVTLAALLLENNLVETSIIQPGQILDMPNCADDESSLAPSAEETEVVTEEIVTTHTVASGETVLSVAQLYNITVNDLIQANTIPDPNNLTVGQQLVIPNQ